MTALVANAAGEIFELDGYAAMGMAGVTQVPLSQKNTRTMPYGRIEGPFCSIPIAAKLRH